MLYIQEINLMNKIDSYPLKIIDGLPPVTTSKDRVALDIEMYHMKKGQLHRPFGKFPFLGASLDGETVYYIDNEKYVQEFLR